MVIMPKVENRISTGYSNRPIFSFSRKSTDMAVVRAEASRIKPLAKMVNLSTTNKPPKAETAWSSPRAITNRAAAMARTARTVTSRLASLARNTPSISKLRPANASRSSGSTVARSAVIIQILPSVQRLTQKPQRHWPSDSSVEI